MLEVDAAAQDEACFLRLLYSFMQEMRCVHPDYMSTQEDINEKMRAILIDWLIEVELFALNLLYHIDCTYLKQLCLGHILFVA